MDQLIIEPTISNPGVTLSSQTNEFIIYGDSFSISSEIYDKIYTWINNFLKLNDFLSIKFNLIYINGNSAKQIFKLLAFLNNIEKKQISIEWYLNNSNKGIGVFLSKCFDLNFKLIMNNVPSNINDKSTGNENNRFDNVSGHSSSHSNRLNDLSNRSDCMSGQSDNVLKWLSDLYRHWNDVPRMFGEVTVPTHFR